MRAWCLVVLGVVGLAASSGCGGCSDPEAPGEVALGDIIGRIEKADGIPQSECAIRVQGTPRSGQCDQNGQFRVRFLDPGTWDLQITPSEFMVPTRTITTAANPGFITDLGSVRIAPPGRIGGHVLVPPGVSLPYTVISIPGFAGVATQPDPNNKGYVLANVPAGRHDVVMTTELGDAVVEDRMVYPDDITLNVNFDYSMLTLHTLNILGGAAVSGSADRSGITVELVETVNGTIVATTTTSDEGTFSLRATSGVYLVRARRDGPLTATLSGIVVHGENDIVLQTTLIIPQAGDLDGDGIADDDDPDVDGDGYPNASDAFPLDPNESTDSDGDGVGENVDLDRNGDGGVDFAQATPDVDSDTLLDFEDNCPSLANADQADLDVDRVGNRCDNCQGVGNRDQTDSDNNGIGDACEPCVAGGACTPAIACHLGVIECTANGAVCTDTMQASPNGVSCGAGQVCLNGSCGACINGATCTTSSGGSCVIGVTSCSSGQAQCMPSANLVADGTPCGVNQVCDDGVCSACTEGGACPFAANECKVGALQCDTGLPQTCGDSGMNKPDGTSCLTDKFCLNGACLACPQGNACTPTANPCHAGIYQCGTGTATCVDQNTNAPDGSPCGGTNMFCVGGSCTTSPNALQLVSGGAQTGSVGATLAPIVVHLQDGGGNPIVGETITVQLAPGALLAPAPGLTDTNGNTTFTVRLGPNPGTQTFLVLSDVAAPLSLPMTATAQTAGTVLTVVNTDHTSENTGVPGPAAQVHMQGPSAIAVGPNGEYYVSELYSHRVYKIDPQNNLTVVAGGGDYYAAAPYGDGGQATDATLFYPYWLQVFGNELYINDNSHYRIRKVNLSTGIITTVAGGQIVAGPDYGDGGPANAADLGTGTQGVSSFVVAPGGVMYIADGWSRLRKVDANGTISTIYTGACPAGSVGVVGSVKLAVNSAGSLFIAGYLCGTVTGYGVMRLDLDGSRHHIAGNQAEGSTGDGQDARYTQFGVARDLAFDSGGNLIYIDSDNRVRRIDAQTYIVSAVIGDGTVASPTEGAVASMSPIQGPLDAAFLGNDLLVVDSTYAVRRIAGAGTNVPTPIVLSTAAASQSVQIAALSSPMNARLSTTLNGSNYSGLRMTWLPVDPGTALLTPINRTNVNGLAGVTGRPGLVPSVAYRVQARFRNIHGADISGSPLTFTMNATAPTAGTLFTAVNVDRTTAQPYRIPGPSTVAHTVYTPQEFAVASDGTIYFGDGAFYIYKLTPAGVLSIIAGNGASSPSADGIATTVAVYDPQGLDLDELTNTLYITARGNVKILALDLVGGTITAVAGGGTAPNPPYGDNDIATNAELSAPIDVELGPDGALYIMDNGHSSVRRVDRTTNIITTFLTGSACTGGETTHFAGCGSGYCDMNWAGNALYLSGVACGSDVGSYGSYSIVRRNGDASMTLIAGGEPALTDENVAATDALLTRIDAFAIDGSGNVTYAEGNLLRRITAGMVSTLAGTTTAGDAGDGLQASPANSLFRSPWGLAFVPGGHLLIADSQNYCVRVIW